MVSSTANQTQVGYLLSSGFPYEKLICADAGPPIASDYAWTALVVSANVLSFDGPLVIDNRLPLEEVSWLRRELMNRTAPTFLRIVDDYGPENVGHWWYEFVREMLTNPNIGVVHTYTPAEFVKSLMFNRDPRRFVHAPYVYNVECESPIKMRRRKNRILFSGNTDANCYPERRLFLKKMRWSPFLGLFVTKLRHPGYPDIGQNLLHATIGQAYLETVAEYRYAFVSPGRTGSEFLKYREFAYAGACPVGHLPPSLADCPEDAFVRFDGNSLSFLEETILSGNHCDRASSFRSYMRQKRDRAQLRERVNSQLAVAFSE